MKNKNMQQYTYFAKTNNLRQIREERGFTQQVLALACSQSASEISGYERGKHMPRYDILRAIAKFLDVSIEEIYPAVKEIDERVERAKEFIEGQ